MTKHEVKVNWQKKMAFKADVMGHEVIMDAGQQVGGESRGARPKPLMLAALAGCTGMDVVSILKKMKVEPDDFNIIVEGDVTDEHPKHYNKMHIIYEFKGKDLPMKKLEKAVRLSEEKYCGVSAVYKKALELTWEIRTVNE
ncbi:MAG: OsmC family protein [Prolixibacteraceae bacterium]